MVSAVFEDLRSRWTKQLILMTFQRSEIPLAEAEFPWAGITVMVPGEADIECARIAKLTGSAVLTNDSDLLVHDLGPHGAVVLLNSVHMLQDAPGLIEPEIRGLRLHPTELANRLGFVNVPRFAYELTQDPHQSFVELVRRSKDNSGTVERSSGYIEFIREYQPDEPTVANNMRSVQTCDPRVSELFWQYEQPDIYRCAEQPHMYLGILHEDHSRRCAWEQGRFYRAIGYSLLNLSRSAPPKISCVHEFVRRGGRIVAEQVSLGSTNMTASDLNILQERLDLARTIFGHHTQSVFWVLFALFEIHCDPSNTTATPNAVHLERFLSKGFMGKRTEWADIHLMAQIQAVLYSLRILKQLVEITAEKISFQHHGILADLPPLHLLMMSRYEIVKCFSVNQLARNSVGQLFETYD
ncbi:hypothetical protein N7476_010877 [Penicillium atrosanguineum]|uniref:Asteroid domain-containing protein n=1 Tax=Penicillium atrosanguineum TaxID=1132637 RepID=A0A9W9PLJ3_9EURO|nr:hypothetical protein N7476_010877 [Penicillium atrosanguineum]